MELEFHGKEYACKRISAVEVFYQEETAELILPDSSPDVQAVLRSSASACIRDRELRAGCYAVSGGFQTGVLFSTEGGNEPGLLEGWLPFRVSLSSDAISQDDFGTVEIRIRSVDARILNSRKILARVSYAVRLTVYAEHVLHSKIAESDDSVQLRCERTNGVFPVACAERECHLSENIDLPAFGAEVSRILRATPEIRISEQSIVDGKAVIRGAFLLHLLFCLENGQVGCHDLQFPLSQFAQLEEDCKDGTARTHVFITDFSMEQDDLGWLMSASLVIQTVISKCIEIPMITDGYCIDRDFNAEYEKIVLQEPLDAPVSVKTMECVLGDGFGKMVDCEVWLDFPTCRRSDDSISVHSAAAIGALYYDDAGKLCGETVKCEGESAFALASDALCFADADLDMPSFAAASVMGKRITCPVSFSARCFASREVGAMVRAELGEPTVAKDDRPSLLVRRWNGGELWELAKECNTTWGKTKKGWISMAYVKLDSSTGSSDTGSTGGTTGGTTASGTNVKVTGSAVNVRNQPGTSGTKVISSVYRGQSLTITEVKTVGGSVWGKFSGGWISLTYTDYKAPTDSTGGSGTTGSTDTGSTGGSTGTTTPATTTGTVTCSGLNIRASASTSAAIVGSYYKGTTVTVTETKTVNGTVWGKTSKGWISMAYVSTTGSASGSTSGGETAGSSTTYKVTGDVVNVRNGAGTNYSVKSTVSRGTTVTIISTLKVGSTTWGQLSTGGWISMDYLK